MIKRLPRDPGTFRDLVKELHIKPEHHRALAKALDVSERTIRRWLATEAPRSARLSLWWLSHESHNEWDCEMAARTQLAIQLKDALWREISELRRQLAAVQQLDLGSANQPIYYHL